MLVLGAGAVGLLVCALARTSGCTTVVAVEQGKLAFAKEMDWVTGVHPLPKGPRVSGLDALEVAKAGWEGLRASEEVQAVEGLEDGFDAVFECTGVESCMQLSVMVGRPIRAWLGKWRLGPLDALTCCRKGRRTRHQSPHGRHGHR